MAFVSHIPEFKRRLRNMERAQVAEAIALIEEPARRNAEEHRRTGRMVDELKTRVQRKGGHTIGEVGFTEHAFYASFLEFGTQKLTPVPLLGDAFDEVRAEVQAVFERPWNL